MTRPLIMVIDESVLILDFMQVLLNSEGYAVIGCYPGATNTAYIRHLCPNLLIVEIQRQNLDHITAFIQEIRADPITSDLPMLVMSTDSELLTRIDLFLQQHTCIAVEKPFEPDRLLKTMHQLITTPVTREQYEQLANENRSLA